MTELGKILKSKVEQIVQQVRNESLMYIKAANGELTDKELAHFLSNVAYIIAKTPAHCRKAAAQCQKLGTTQYAPIFMERHNEEVGHEQWAQDDIRYLERDHGTDSKNLDIVPGAVKLLSVIDLALDTHPGHYASYMLWAEYLTVLIVPGFASDLEHRCKISKDAISVLTKHQELDQHHTEKNITEIIDPLQGMLGCEPEGMLAVMDAATSAYIQLTTEICRDRQFQQPLRNNSQPSFV